MHVTAPPAADQALSAYEIQAAPVWCSGLNKGSWDETTLEKYVHHQVGQELALDRAYVSSPGEHGRGLMVARAFREEEDIIAKELDNC